MAASLKLDKSQVHFKLSYGIESKKKQRCSGRWPGSSQPTAYELGTGRLQMSSAKEILSGSFSSDEDIYIRDITMRFRINHSGSVRICGGLPGSPGLVLSDMKNSLRFKRNKKIRQIISFSHKGNQIKIRWEINCSLPADSELKIDPIQISRSDLSIHPSEPGIFSSPRAETPKTIWCFPSESGRPLRLKELEDNLSWMEQERFFFDIVMLDGLHGKWGDWDSVLNDFRGKTGFITRRIQHNGMLPGLTVSPFLAESTSEIVRLHPDWVVGELKGDSPLTIQRGQTKYHILDFTQKAVMDYLGSSFEQFKKQWGFRAFHLRHLDVLLLPGRKQNMKIEGGRLLYRALAFIRENLGAETFISAEDIPLITHEGLLSMVSLPHGNFSRRKSKKKIPRAIRKLMEQSYVSHYPWQLNTGSYPLPGEKEIFHPQAGESLRQMTLIAGGILTVGNDLSRLSEAELNELKALIPSFSRFAGGRLHYLGNNDKKAPCVLFNSNGYLGVFNLNSGSQKLTLDMEQLHQDIYNRSGRSAIREGKTGMNTGRLELILPPYGSRIFKF